MDNIVSYRYGTAVARNAKGARVFIFCALAYVSFLGVALRVKGFRSWIPFFNANYFGVLMVDFFGLWIPFDGNR